MNERTHTTLTQGRDACERGKEQGRERGERGEIVKGKAEGMKERKGRKCNGGRRESDKQPEKEKSERERK